MSKKVTLQVRIPPKVAISILGRLYAGKHLTKDQYETKINQIDKTILDKEKKKRIKMDKILSKVLKKGIKRIK